MSFYEKFKNFRRGKLLTDHLDEEDVQTLAMQEFLIEKHNQFVAMGPKWSSTVIRSCVGLICSAIDDAAHPEKVRDEIVEIITQKKPRKCND